MNVLLFSLFFTCQASQPSPAHVTLQDTPVGVSQLESAGIEDSKIPEEEISYTPYAQRVYSASPEYQTMFGIRASSGAGNILLGRSKRIEVYKSTDEGLTRTAILNVGADILNPGTFGTNFVSDGITVAEISLGTGAPQMVTIHRCNNDVWKSMPHITAGDIPAKDIKLKRKVSIHGDEIAVLSSRGVEIFTFDGSRYVWKQFVERPADINDRLFGSSLNLGKDKLAVGCWRGPTNQEHVEVFSRAGGSWKHTAHIVDSRGAPSERFGVQTKFDGNNLMIAASNWSEATGCILVYKEVVPAEGQEVSIDKRWKEVQRISQLEGNECCFGTSFRVDKNTLAVAACSKMTKGSVILFKRESPETKWVFDDLILPDPAMGNLRFGSDIALSGSKLVVGIPFGSKEGVGSTGMAQVYNVN